MLQWRGPCAAPHAHLTGMAVPFLIPRAMAVKVSLGHPDVPGTQETG